MDRHVILNGFRSLVLAPLIQKCFNANKGDNFVQIYTSVFIVFTISHTQQYGKLELTHQKKTTFGFGKHVSLV